MELTAGYTIQAEKRTVNIMTLGSKFLKITTERLKIDHIYRTKGFMRQTPTVQYHCTWSTRKGGIRKTT